MENTILPAGAENFLQLKTRIRDGCFENRIDILDAIQARDTSGKNIIPWDTFTAILKEQLDIEVSLDELKFIAKRFINHRNEFSYVPFHKLLDIQPPEGYTDPELLFDQLPQPYRMIAKVMEEDIIEKAWEMILKKEAEGVSNIGPGSGWLYGVPKAAFAGKGSFCYPSFQSIAKYDVGFITAIGSNADGDRLLIGTAQGRLCLVDPNLDRPLAMELAYQKAVGGVYAISNLVGRAHATSQSGGDIPMTGATVAHPPGEEGALIKVYECWNEEPHLTLRFILKTEEKVSRVIIAPDAEYLAVCTKKNTVMLYALPAQTVKPDPRVEEEKRKEKEKAAQKNQLAVGGEEEPVQVEEEMPFPPETVELPQAPMLSIPCPAAFKFDAEAAAAAAALEETEPQDNDEAVPEPPAPFIPLPVPAIHFVVMSAKAGERTTGMLLARTGTNVFQRYHLGPAAVGRVEVQEDGVDEEPEPPAKDAKKGKNAPEEAPAAVVILEPKALWDKEWTLPAPINCSVVDSSTSLLAFGLADGTVLVWNVHSGVAQSICGRHEKGVTSIDIHRQQYIVSGSEDKLVHIYDLGDGGSAKDRDSTNKGSSSSSSKRGRARSKLVSLCSESGVPITRVKCFSDVPIAACFDAHYCCRAYDLQSGELLGELGTSSDGSWASVMGLGNSEASTLDAHGDQLCVLALPSAEWGMFTESSEKCDEILNAATGPPKDPEEGQEPEELPPPPPVLPSSSLNMFVIEDLICDLCPGIAKACSGFGSKDQAKHLFVTTEPTKRADPDADLLRHGLGGGFGSGGGAYDAMSMAFGTAGHNNNNNAVGRGPGSAATGTSRSSRKRSTTSRGASRGGLGSSSTMRGGQHGGQHGHANLGALPSAVSGQGGLSSAMLAEPVTIKLLRAPAYVDPASRAMAEARRSTEKRAHREHSQSARRAELLQSMVPQMT